MSDEGLDPGLVRLFDAAGAVETHNEAAFVSELLVELEKARRARLLVRLVVTTIIVITGAILAPYVARTTLTVMEWLVASLPQTGMALASPVGCVCAALIAWRIAHRRFS
jgi:hypothetical protein